MTYLKIDVVWIFNVSKSVLIIALKKVNGGEGADLWNKEGVGFWEWGGVEGGDSGGGGLCGI